MWILIWQLAAMGLGHGGLFLATPLQTLVALAQLAPTAAFWQRIVFSALRIMAGFLLAAAGAALLLYRRHKRRQYPYRQKFLLTKTEYAFYKILEEKCTKNGLRICPKVRLEDFISVTGTKNIGKYRGYIKSRHVDFLICDKDLHIKAGLELDDSSHETRQAAQTDKFKNELFESIGLPLFRIKTIRSEYERQIDKMISQIRRMR